MKTATYLRLSLLIPVLVWGICLLLIIIASTSPLKEFVSRQSTVPSLVGLFFMSYTLGIVFWVFPYLLLTLILMVLSFIVHPRATLKLFAFSPVVMTILTLLFMNVLAMGTAGDGSLLSTSTIKDQDFIAFNGLVLLFSLIWGYICVAIGLGIYRLLQRLELIRDDASIASAARLMNQYESRAYQTEKDYSL